MLDVIWHTCEGIITHVAVLLEICIALRTKQKNAYPYDVIYCFTEIPAVFISYQHQHAFGERETRAFHHSCSCIIRSNINPTRSELWAQRYVLRKGFIIVATASYLWAYFSWWWFSLSYLRCESLMWSLLLVQAPGGGTENHPLDALPAWIPHWSWMWMKIAKTTHSCK